MEEIGVTERYCAGCGVKIQSEDKAKPGFVPANAWQREVLICQRCFRIKHYNETITVAMEDDDFLHIVHSIGTSPALVVMVVDIFDFQGSWLRGLPRLVGGNPILLAGNKVDLLPRNINLNRVRNWLQREAKEQGLKPLDVQLISAAKGIGIDELLLAISRHRQGRDVYIVGVTNVGKSTLVNRIVRDYGSGEIEITTSPFPGTTLDKIEIPLEDGSYLYDTPGVVNRDQISHLLTPADLRTITPASRINPKVYQLQNQQSIFIGGLARIDFVRGEPQPFVFYTANAVKLHRTKLEKADQLLKQHHGQLLSPPTGEAIQQLPPFVKHPFKISARGATDVVISGLGWVTLQGKHEAYIEVHVPKGVRVGVRKALI